MLTSRLCVMSYFWIWWYFHRSVYFVRFTELHLLWFVYFSICVWYFNRNVYLEEKKFKNQRHCSARADLWNRERYTIHSFYPVGKHFSGWTPHKSYSLPAKKPAAAKPFLLLRCWKALSTRNGLTHVRCVAPKMLGKGGESVWSNRKKEKKGREGKKEEKKERRVR